MSYNHPSSPSNLNEPIIASFRPCDPRDIRNLPDTVFWEKNLEFCRNRESAHTQITRIYEDQARAPFEVSNVPLALASYESYKHILTEGEVAEFKVKGRWYRVLVRRTFSDKRGKIQIKLPSGRLLEVDSWALSWREFFVSDR